MSEVKHTPGPWEMVEHEDSISIQQSSSHYSEENLRGVAGIFHREGVSDEDRSNAKLITAAPEMLHYCKLYLESLRLQTENFMNPGQLDLKRQLERLIKKVER